MLGVPNCVWFHDRMGAARAVPAKQPTNVQMKILLIGKSVKSACPMKPPMNGKMTDERNTYTS